MFQWVSKLLGNQTFNIPAGVPEVWVQRLATLLEPLNDKNSNGARPGISLDIINYVLHGEPISVLHEVAQNQVVGEHLKLLGYYYGGAKEKNSVPDVYEHINEIPAPIALRWARVLEASVNGVGCCLVYPGNVHWPEVLQIATARTSLLGWSSERAKAKHLTHTSLEAMLVADGLPAHAALASAFATPVQSAYAVPQRAFLVTDLTDYADALDRHIDAIRTLLAPSSVNDRLHVIAMLQKARPETLDQLANPLVDLAVSGSKQVRVQAEALLSRTSDAIFTPLRAIAEKGKPEARLNALRLIHLFGRTRERDDEVNFAQSMAAADKAASVQALVAEWESNAQSQAEVANTYAVEMPIIDWSAANCAIPDSVLQRFWQALFDQIERSNADARSWHAKSVAQGHSYKLTQIPHFNDADKAKLKAHLSSGNPNPAARIKQSHYAWHHWDKAFATLSNSEGVSPAAMLKVLDVFGLAHGHYESLSPIALNAWETLHERTRRPTLLELSCMHEAIGKSGATLIKDYCRSWGKSLAEDWPNDDVWPYFAHHLDATLQALLNNTLNDYSFSRAGLFRAIGTMPTPPAAAVNAIYTLALGSGKTDRLDAQHALQHFPDKEARIISALADGKADTRTVAANWLARLRHAPAIPALEAAVNKEKHDIAKGAMLDALQTLGQPVDKYLNRDALAAEAAKSLAKGVPKDLEFFPWSAMPEVHWQDNGALVPPDVLRWMLVQAVKQKAAEPNAVLRKYCELFVPREREAFGQFVLETWMQEDTRPISPEEAMTRAKNSAQSTHQYMTQYPQYSKDSPDFGRSVEELTARYLPGLLRTPAGSANGSKGLLAVAAACARERAAAPVQRYLKEWYGTRPAQGRALITMLAWIDHPSATQLMLSIGSRFRTKSFQEEATRQAEALADRKGWTLSELADRTVPSAGFDETGTLELNYGSRTFNARLLPDFKIELFNAEGKKLTSLPEPRMDDDAALAKDAKKALSGAKKEIKTIVELQTERLYEALCTEREWLATDWASYLQSHPILRHLVQRLVWIERINGETTRVFRPLDDGTLTDHDDNPVTLSEGAHVRLAHDTLMDAEAVNTWQQHLVDYEIQPLFQQLGKGSYALPEGKQKQDTITDFEGHLLESFALRGRALKLGYTRGPAEDGGWFYLYQKNFPTLGMKAQIEFTGGPLPEENRTVALKSLSFASNKESAGYGASMPLSKVPKILLSECYNDLRLLSAAGTGFDPEWEKKSEY